MVLNNFNEDHEIKTGLNEKGNRRIFYGVEYDDYERKAIIDLKQEVM